MKYTLAFTFVFCASMSFAQNDTLVKIYTKNQLLSDYDLAVSALKESHPGLYWYTNFADYEEVFKSSRDEIRDSMNSYDFYRIISRIVSADKEGHSDVYRPSDIADYVNMNAKLLPFSVIPVDNQLYILNDIGNKHTKGLILKEINSISIDTIILDIFRHKSKWSDGYTTTGKYDNLEYFNFAFSYHYYLDDFLSESARLLLQNPKTKKFTTIDVGLITRDEILQVIKSTPYIKRKTDDQLFALEVKPKSKTAILTFNDFSYDRYERGNTSFGRVVDSLFSIVKENRIKNLIIDIRNNSGGSEGAEDYLFSHLAQKEYTKYKYVEAKAFQFSFLENTNYNSQEDRDELHSMLYDEHNLVNDGRILRKKEVLPTENPKSQIYKGNLYILISGRTFSGGAEFAAIAKDQSNATFIGEETGGGFYGQTSGSYIHLFLPITDVHIRIPLLKFVTTFESDDIPYGHGVIPDYKVEQTYDEYINGVDAQLQFTLRLIRNAD